MPDQIRTRRPIKAGYFTVPSDPDEPPRFLGTRCNDCGEHFWPRRSICAKCMSENTVSVELGPSGTLYSYTFVHFPLFGSTNMELLGGYGVGQVDLDEGPRVQAPLAGGNGEFRIGQKMVAEIATLREDGSEDIVIFRFRPREEEKR